MSVSVSGKTCAECFDSVVVQRGGRFGDFAGAGLAAFDRKAAEALIATLPIDELRRADNLAPLRTTATVVVVSVAYHDGRREQAAVPIGRASYPSIGTLEQWAEFAGWQATRVIMNDRQQALRAAFNRGRLRSIELEALGCYGWCPRYTVTFRSTGVATIHDRGPHCNITATARVVFRRVIEATTGASRLLSVYPVQAVDTFGARITLSTDKRDFTSDGRDRTSWGPEFLGIESRLDQIVRDARWSPAIDLRRCAGGPTSRL